MRCELGGREFQSLWAREHSRIYLRFLTSVRELRDPCATTYPQVYLVDCVHPMQGSCEGLG